MIRTVHPGWRLVFPPFLVLTALSTVILYVSATDTDEIFAWTVRPPVSAAFLGAGYASGFVLMALTVRERVWANARVALVTVLVFTLCTLGATLAHVGNFHFDRTGLPRFAAWFWLAVYVAVPLTMSVVLVLQLRMPGGDPEVRRPLPPVLRIVLAAQALVLGVVGAALLLDPTRMQSLWPWELTPLTARAIGAWAFALGVAAAMVVAERDAWRLRAAAVTFVMLGVLHLGALVRFDDDIRWGEPQTWIYLVVVASMVVTGLWGRILSLGTPAEPRPQLSGTK
ncbi:MAG: hypothetical protein MUE36_04355 [Acidimicrobiales bacterium]|nr:hypothetical protein [Acidimicrobiales bacterium]